MPSAFSQALKSLHSEIHLGDDSTPNEKRDKRANEKQDAKATPAKKRKENPPDSSDKSTDSKKPGEAATSRAAPKSRSKAAFEQALKAAGVASPAINLDTTVSREDLASREAADGDSQPKAKAKATRRKKSEAKLEGDEAADAVVKKPKKAKPEGPYTKFKDDGCIPEPSVQRREVPADTKSLKVVSWNVGGLRSWIKNRADALPNLVKQEAPDVIALSEHKLQEGADDTETTMQALLEALPDYECPVLNCSTVKKGYSGTLVLMRKELPKPISVEKLELSVAKDEGRLILAEFEKVILVVAYVPNSGDGLKRLDERISQWDADFRDKLKEYSAKKPTVLIGDLNVAHRDVDIWNVEAPHVPKSAGTTNEERESFSSLLGAGFVDGFAHLHPEALGAFTYWSVRAGNRPKNRGLRLDYAVVSKALLSHGEGNSAAPSLLDVFHLPEMSTGDHCPVGAIIGL